MPQPWTHLLVGESSLEDTIRELSKDESGTTSDLTLKLLTKIGNSGTLGTDLFYAKDKNTIISTHPRDYSHVSNVMHWEASFDLFCAMLNYTKQIPLDKATRNKLKVFAYGFYSHVVTDAVFHPFVYRLSGDNPTKHNKKGYLSHKEIERAMDYHNVKRLKRASPLELGFSGMIGLQTQDDDKVGFDRDIFKMLSHAIKVAYAAKRSETESSVFESYNIDFYRYFAQYSFSRKNPIVDAFHDFESEAKILYSPRSAFTEWIIRSMPQLKVFDQSRELTPAQQKLVEEGPGREWVDRYSPIPPYNTIQLFDLAVKGTKKIIEESERFFASSEFNAKAFFSRRAHTAAFLNNTNHDAGLSSDRNPVLMGLPQGEAAYKFGLKEIAQNYRTIEQCSLS